MSTVAKELERYKDKGPYWQGVYSRARSYGHNEQAAIRWADALSKWPNIFKR